MEWFAAKAVSFIKPAETLLSVSLSDGIMLQMDCWTMLWDLWSLDNAMAVYKGRSDLPEYDHHLARRHTTFEKNIQKYRADPGNPPIDITELPPCHFQRQRAWTKYGITKPKSTTP